MRSSHVIRRVVALAVLLIARSSAAQVAHPSSTSSEASDAALDEETRRPPVVPPYFPINVSLIHPIATNAFAPDLWTSFDLGIVLGRVGFVDGAQLGTIGWITHDLRGAQIAVISAVSGKTSGVQLGAGFAFAEDRVEGLQIAGLLGWANHDVRGAEIAGLVNQTYGDIEGVQAAGFINIARQEITGVQASGGVNIGRVQGLQIGVVNVSRDVEGLQIGIINVARRIHGLQIGIVNVTDNLEGESLGVAPLPRSGGVHIVAWGSSSIAANVGVKFASRYAYSIVSGALEDRQLGAGLTLGARVVVEGDLAVAGDLGGYRFFGDGFGLHGHDEIFKVRALVSYQVVPHLMPFVGAGAFVWVQGTSAVVVERGPEVSAGVEF